MKKFIMFFVIVLVILFGYINLYSELEGSQVKIKSEGGIVVSGAPSQFYGDLNGGGTVQCGNDHSKSCYETNGKGQFIGSGHNFNYFKDTRIDIFLFTDILNPLNGYGFVDAITAHNINQNDYDSPEIIVDLQTQTTTNYNTWLMIADY